jgi:hypothetical protein
LFAGIVLAAAMLATISCRTAASSDSATIVVEGTAVRVAGFTTIEHGSTDGGTSSAVPFWILKGTEPLDRLKRQLSDIGSSRWRLSDTSNADGSLATLLLVARNPEQSCVLFVDLRSATDAAGVLRDQLIRDQAVASALAGSPRTTIVGVVATRC